MMLKMLKMLLTMLTGQSWRRLSSSPGRSRIPPGPGSPRRTDGNLGKEDGISILSYLHQWHLLKVELVFCISYHIYTIGINVISLLHFFIYWWRAFQTNVNLKRRNQKSISKYEILSYRATAVKDFLPCSKFQQYPLPSCTFHQPHWENMRAPIIHIPSHEPPAYSALRPACDGLYTTEYVAQRNKQGWYNF